MAKPVVLMVAWPAEPRLPPLRDVGHRCRWCKRHRRPTRHCHEAGVSQPLETIAAVKRAMEGSPNTRAGHDGQAYRRHPAFGPGVAKKVKKVKKVMCPAKPGNWLETTKSHQSREPSHHPPTDHIPPGRVLIRHGRRGFWVGPEAFRYTPFMPHKRFTRRFLNDFMHT
ncbi:uncharacterized protein B0T15DRAFT_513783 [Chaetomium strumarium]|uniref:Uncharacterized protein n=1 Tax=Chaetomium strumarium TaxID=1170767 RepID=A0AAJ0LZQ1_9PEZI|nr:hypothetical protein B0T15DRAFT_513783 [Chaetomium strumarium]